MVQIDALKSPSFWVKIVELILSIISVAIVGDWVLVGNNTAKVALVFGTLVGFIMISIVVIVGSVINHGLHKTLILLISVPAAVLFFASGACMIEVWDKGVLGVPIVPDRVVGAGVIALINGIVYTVDAALTLFKSEEQQ